MESNYIQQMLNPDHNQVENMFQDLTIITNTPQFQDDHVVDHHESDEEEEFSFTPPAGAEDGFMDGQMKPVFPLFNMDLMQPPHVQKVFVELAEKDNDNDEDEIYGPYCDLSNRKVVEVDAEDACKKSNSTGFSKIWRFKDFIGRSNSDGRDAFVFFNNAHTHTRKEEEVVVNKNNIDHNIVSRKKVKKAATNNSSSSPHEVYLKRRAKDEERRRPSYLPYRPELMGFFTNVNGGGLTRNVHPY